MQNLKDVYDIEACFEAPPWGPRGLHIGTNLQAQHLLYQITHRSQAQQTRSGYACTILLTHPKPSSWSDQRVPPHCLLSTSVPLVSHLSHVLLPPHSVLLTSSPRQTLSYCLLPSSPQVCCRFPAHAQSCCPSNRGQRVVPLLHHPQSSLQATFTPSSPLIAVGTPRGWGNS